MAGGKVAAIPEDKGDDLDLDVNAPIAEGEGEDEEQEAAPVGHWQRLRGRLYQGKDKVQHVVGLENQEKKPPLERDRLWEMSVALRSFRNHTRETITFFFVLSLEGNSEKLKRKPKLRLLPKYTATYTLGKDKTCTPLTPVRIFSRKEFKLSYKDLERHHVKVDIWEVSCWTFNKYLGFGKKKLSEIATKDPSNTLMLKRKLTREQAQAHRQRTAADVAQVSLTITLEEIFDFTLECDNWTLEPSEGHEEHKNARLTFVMPKNKKSLPGFNNMPRANTMHTTNWIERNEVGAFFWPNCGKSNFAGTRSHLINSCFLVVVRTPSAYVPIVTNNTVEKFSPSAVHNVGGRCLMNLISVLQVSVFQGKVKNYRNFRVNKGKEYGKLCGNVKAVMRSKSLPEEPDLKIERPQQLALVANVANLNPAERHLVVKVRKCENLPGGDADTGLSDPFLRVTWDSSTMRSGVMKGTIRPVFNQAFYFPVRMVRLTSRERKYRKEILKVELRSKNIIKLEVWDDDQETHADYLGGCQIKLGDIFAIRGKEDANMMGRVKKAVDTNSDEDQAEEEEEVPEKNEWFMERKKCRVYDGSRAPLTGSSKRPTAQPVIHFEAFFYPDWEDDVAYDDDGEDAEEEDWKDIKKDWDRETKAFAADYKAIFPDSLGARPCNDDLGTIERASSVRRFPWEGVNPLTMKDCPLMAFVSPIIIPEYFSFPAFLMHWVHCLGFEAGTSQQRTGLLPSTGSAGGWNPPEFFLQRRKGAPQDHALLLCSLLLGCKKDAFVVKGTWGEGDREHVEHVWVMTREEGWVTFWEPCTRQMYHMPSRYKKCKRDKDHKAKRPGARHHQKKAVPEGEEGHPAGDGAEGVKGIKDEENAEAEEEVVRREAPQWEDEVEDVHLGPEELMGLPTIGRMPKPKMRAEGGRGRKDHDQEVIKKQLGAQVVAPIQKLVNHAHLLVDWLPYASIEVVFNDTNLWANRQNHHPACITYDFEGSEDEESPEANAQKGKPPEKKEKKPKWAPLIKKDENEQKMKAKVARLAISPNVSLTLNLTGTRVDEIRTDLLTEMQQNLELHRSRKGMDTNFDPAGPEVDRNAYPLTRQLRAFLEIHEDWMHIDPDYPMVRDLMDRKKPAEELSEENIDFEEFILRILGPRQWNKRGSPFFGGTGLLEYANYNKDQDRKWRALQEKIESFQQNLPNFPAKRGKKFRGFPVHFSTSEADSIREYLMCDETFKEFINSEDEDIVYTIECKIFPLLGGVLSVWLYIGVHERARETS